MPHLADAAICIRRWDWSESSQTVSLFLREHGVLRGIAKGAKRAKGSFSGGIDVLTRGHIVAILKRGAELATITEWHLEEVYRSVRESLAVNRAALYMADLVHHMVREHDPHPSLFDAMVAALDSLRADDVQRPLLHFHWTLLTEAGYRPELDRDAASGTNLPATGPLGFSSRAGGVVSPAGMEARWLVRRGTIDLLRDLAGGATLRVAQAGVPTIERANRLLAAYIRDLLGEEPATMRWAFGDK